MSDFERLQKVIKLRDRLSKRAVVLLAAVEHINEYLEAQEPSVELELEDWICPGCDHVHAASISGRLAVAQPKDDKIHCCACDNTFLVEAAIAQLEKYRRFLRAEQEERDKCNVSCWEGTWSLSAMR